VTTQVSGDASLARPGGGLLVVGLAILAAVFPFHFWLPGLSEDASPEDTALTLALVSGSAAVLVVEVLRSQAEHLADRPEAHLMLAAGLLSAGAAALLALTPGPARQLSYLASSSLAFSLAGLADHSDVGVVGAVFGVLAVPPALLLGLLCLRELSRHVSTGGKGNGEGVVVALARRSLLASFGLAAATLSLVGVPPLAGFASRWAVYAAAAAEGDGYLVAALGVTALGVVVAARMLRPLLSPGEGDEVARVPASAVPLIAALLLALVAFGLYPEPFVGIIQSALGVPAG
jgi:NADH-quinone oxidoreductase subunit N